MSAGSSRRNDVRIGVHPDGDGRTPLSEVNVAWTPASNISYGEYPASASSDAQADLPAIADRVFGGLDNASLAKARYGNAMMLVCRVDPTFQVVVTPDDIERAEVDCNDVGGDTETRVAVALRIQPGERIAL